MSAETIKFEVGNLDLTKNLVSYSIKWDLFSGMGSFHAVIDKRSKIWVSASPTKFRWTINGHAMMQGYVDKVDINYSKTTFTQTIEGRDMMQVWTDNYVLAPKPYTGKPLGYIVNDVLATSQTVSSIRTINESGHVVTQKLDKSLNIPQTTVFITYGAWSLIVAVNNFKEIRTNHEQSIFEFISSLCNQVGLFLYNKPGSDVIIIHCLNAPNSVFQSYATDGSVSTEPDYPIHNGPTQSYNQNKIAAAFVPPPGISPALGAPNNVLSCSFTEDTRSMYKYIKLIGNCGGEESSLPKAVLNALGLGTGGQGPKIEKIESVPTPTDPKPKSITPADLKRGYQGVTKFKVNYIKEADIQSWYNTRGLLINNDVLKQNRKLYRLQYSMSGYSPMADGKPSGGQPYWINHAAQVWDDFLGFSGNRFLVYGVEYTGSKTDGFKTNLELCIPEVTDLTEYVAKNIQQSEDAEFNKKLKKALVAPRTLQVL